MTNKWKIGDLAYLAGCSTIKILKVQRKNVVVEMVNPFPHSNYKKGDIFTMCLSFVHKTPHRVKGEESNGQIKV